MESRPDLDQSRQRAIDRDRSLGGLEHAAQQLQDRALTGPVMADDSQSFAASDRERDVAQRPELARTRTTAMGPPEELRRQRRQRITQRIEELAFAKLLPHTVHS